MQCQILTNNPPAPPVQPTPWFSTFSDLSILVLSPATLGKIHLSLFLRHPFVMTDNNMVEWVAYHIDHNKSHRRDQSPHPSSWTSIRRPLIIPSPYFYFIYHVSCATFRSRACQAIILVAQSLMMQISNFESRQIRPHYLQITAHCKMIGINRTPWR